MSKARILVDMDGVLADFESEMARRWREHWPADDIDSYLNRSQFKFDTAHDSIKSIAIKFNQIWSEPGFF